MGVEGSILNLLSHLSLSQEWILIRVVEGITIISIGPGAPDDGRRALDMRQIATLSSPEYRSTTGREQSGYPLETHQISIETGTTPAPEGYDFNPPSRNAGESLECRPNLTPFESGCWPNARGCWRKATDRPTNGRGDGLGTPRRWAPGWRRGISLTIAAPPGTPAPPLVRH